MLSLWPVRASRSGSARANLWVYALAGLLTLAVLAGGCSNQQVPKVDPHLAECMNDVHDLAHQIKMCSMELLTCQSHEGEPDPPFGGCQERSASLP